MCILLGRNFDFLGGYLVVTAHYLVVTARYLVVTGGYSSLSSGYCSLLDGYCSLLVVTARYCSFPLLVWTRKHAGFYVAHITYSKMLVEIIYKKLVKLVHISGFMFTSNFGPSSLRTELVYLLLYFTVYTSSIKTFTYEQFSIVVWL